MNIKYYSTRFLSENAESSKGLQQFIVSRQFSFHRKVKSNKLCPLKFPNIHEQQKQFFLTVMMLVIDIFYLTLSPPVLTKNRLISI